MSQHYSRRPISWGLASALYLITALAVIRLAALSAEMAAFWPANGILIYALLVGRRQDRWKQFGGAFAASVIANLVAGKLPAVAALYSCANMIEAWLVIALLEAAGLRRGQLLEPRGIAIFPAAAAIAAAASATLADVVHSPAFGRAWLSWFGSDLLGMALVVPAMLVMFSRPAQPVTRSLRQDLGALMLTLVGVAAVAYLVFVPNTAPIAFFCILPVIVAVFRFGARGAVYSALLFATISIVATLSGRGPFAAFTADAVLQVYLLQAFLVALLLAGLPLAALHAREARAAQRALSAERKARRVSDQRKRALELAARATALANSRDNLTGLATRARILGKLRARLHLLARSGEPLVAALIDIDHFKTINDRFGHDQGDTVLQGFGALARQTFPAPHGVGRLGGEEFLVILSGLDQHTALRRMEEFRLLVELRGETLVPGSFSISTGVAAAVAGTTPSDLLRLADLALLQAKRQGRNRTLLAA